MGARRLCRYCIAVGWGWGDECDADERSAAPSRDRRAHGAGTRDIAWLFLLEALLLAGGGALLGTLVGLAASWGFALLSGWRYALDASSIGLGMGSALSLGLFFGLQPALAAAHLQPVLALRDD
ncbi:FtsX-like permease family protein [Pseudomonas sp. NPDC089758]|uniref:FtsX-like permease family protein n=1 Tax=Pseudomonas sp. NPDC089758 TaxID=3364473 RepID=UPI00380FF6D9